jgi:serine/threonine protein kinase
MGVKSSPICFHDRALRAFEAWDEEDYTHIRTIAKAQCGKVDLFEDKLSGEKFAVKVMPKNVSRPNVGIEMVDERGSGRRFEDPLNEVGVMAHLADLGVKEVLPEPRRFCTDDAHDYILLKHCPVGDLFDFVTSHGAPLSEEILKSKMQKLLEVVQRLHTANIAHRDISLENILVDNEDLRLIDFSQAVPIHDFEDVASEPLRYFVKNGKDHYRAPEAFLPQHGGVSVRTMCPVGSKGGEHAFVRHGIHSIEVKLPDYASPGKQCTCIPRGYCAAPVDVFACGACFFAMSFLRPDALSAGDTERHVRSCNRQSRLHQPLSESAMDLLCAMLQQDPTKRITIDDALRHAWFS